MTTTPDIHELRIVVDRSRPLAPQIVVWRRVGVPWALLEDLAGKPKNRLEEMVARWRQSREGVAGEAGNC